MTPNQVPYVPPLRGSLSASPETKRGELVTGQLRCPDHPTRSLKQGNGTVLRCPSCRAKILDPAGGVE